MEKGFINKINEYLEFLKSNYILVIISAIILCIISYFLFVNYVVPYLNPKSSSITTNEGFDSSSKTAQLMFFYADWCPHCKTAKPIMEDLKSEYNNKQINGYRIIFTDIDCSQETPEIERLMNKFNVEGFPTIKLIKDEQVIEYDAKPNKDTLIKFLNTVI